MNAVVLVALVLISATVSAFRSESAAKPVSNGSQTALQFELDDSSSGYIIIAAPLYGYTQVWANALHLDSGEYTGLPSQSVYYSNFRLVLRESTVYAVGGFYNNAPHSTLILSIKDGMWKNGSDLVFDYGSVLSASVNESIYAVGGDGNGHTLQVIGCNGAWNRLTSSIYSHNSDDDSIAVLSNKIYVQGCHHQDEVYDPSMDTWTAIKMTNQDRCHAGIVALNGYIYVIGGSTAKNERYYPETGETIYFETCLYSPVSMAGVVTDGEKIYVIGGYVDGAWSKKVQVYRPDLDLWQTMGEYPLNINYLGVVYVKELPTD